MKEESGAFPIAGNRWGVLLGVDTRVYLFVALCVCEAHMELPERVCAPRRVCAFLCLCVRMRAHVRPTLVQQTCCLRNLSASSEERRIFHNFQPQNDLHPNLDLDP